MARSIDWEISDACKTSKEMTALTVGVGTVEHLSMHLENCLSPRKVGPGVTVLLDELENVLLDLVLGEMNLALLCLVDIFLDDLCLLFHLSVMCRRVCVS